jgi:Transposase DDE domain
MLAGMINTDTILVTQELLALLSEIDEFKGAWRALSTIAPERLNALRHVATVESIGSSTRIEGSKLTDREVERLLGSLEIRRFGNRDEQEVAGYCGPCEQRSRCTTGPFRYLAIHMNETARQRARDLRTTPEFGQAQRQRKKAEALFAELKSHSQIGLNRLRLRRLKFVREQFFLAATAQNIKRLVRFLSQTTTMSPVPATS